MRYLNPIQQSRDIVQEFRGYNHNLRIAEGEFYDEQNMSSDFYPVMSPRKPREQTNTVGVNGLIALGKDLFYTTNRKLYKRDEHGTSEELYNFRAISTVADNVPRSLIAFGAYIVVFPDGVYYNTINPEDKGDINNTFTIPEPEMGEQAEIVKFTLCDIDGEDYTATASASAPSNPYDGDYWLDTSETKSVLKRYSSSITTWIVVEQTYIKIASKSISKGYAVGDGVTISGADDIVMPEINTTHVLQAVYTDTVYDGRDDYIVVIGTMNGSTQYSDWSGEFKAERKAPIMDFVVEANNRLWGCRHGLNNDGVNVNEIYACKLGDFKNWTVFDGISTDSYIASVGSYGDFTGAVTYLSYPIFFKENCLHKVYGSVPANFQINTAACNGVVAGAANSIAICDARVYYKSRAGVCVYDGSLPQDISTVFGGELYNGMAVEAVQSEWGDWALHRAGACGGADDYKYYLSCANSKDVKWSVFVYDTRTGIWHREDNTHVTAFAFADGVMYFVDASSIYISEKYKLCRMNADAGEDVAWYAESGEIGLLLPDKQYVAKIVLKMACALGAQMDISIQYDGVGDWRHVETVHGTGVASQTVAVKPERCAFFRLRFSGLGDVKLYGYIKTTETGSDI